MRPTLKQFRRMMLFGGLWVGGITTVLLLFAPGAPLLGIPIVWAFVGIQQLVIRSDAILKVMASLDRETYVHWFGDENDPSS